MPELDISKILGRNKSESVITVAPETTEDNWEDEGGAFVSEELFETPVGDLVNVTLAYNPPEHPLYEKYNKLLTELKELRDKKGKDYGTTEDPFANVRGAQEFGVKPWIGAANSANDCMTRIKQYAKTGRLENESVRDSMLDLANYSLIALVLWEEENEKRTKENN